MGGAAQITVKVGKGHICRNVFQRIFNIQHPFQPISAFQRLHQGNDLTAVRSFQIGFQIQVGIGRNIIAAVHKISPCAAHALGFVKVTCGICKSCLQEDFVHRFYRQIQPPFLAIDGDTAVAALRHGKTHIRHDLIADIFPHIAVIPIVIIQAEFPQAVVIAIIIIIIKIQLETIPIGIRICNRSQAGIAFGTDGCIPHHFSVDGHIRSIIFLRQRIFQEFLPVGFIDGNVDFADSAFLKQMLTVGKFALRLHISHDKIRRHEKQHHCQTCQKDRLIFFQHFQGGSSLPYAA